MLMGSIYSSLAMEVSLNPLGIRLLRPSNLSFPRRQRAGRHTGQSISDMPRGFRLPGKKPVPLAPVNPLFPPRRAVKQDIRIPTYPQICLSIYQYIVYLHMVGLILRFRQALFGSNSFYSYMLARTPQKGRSCLEGN